MILIETLEEKLRGCKESVRRSRPTGRFFGDIGHWSHVKYGGAGNQQVHSSNTFGWWCGHVRTASEAF